MTKHIFVTGAAGFIGYHAAMQLKQRGDHVIGFDNFNDYYSVKLKRDRANELLKAGVKVHEGDVQDFENLKKTVENHQTTHLLHLAAQAGVRYSLQNPSSYLKSNVDGFLNILEVCREYPSIKLIYASSSSVYGLNKKLPYCIEDRTDRQASLYGVTKKANELMAQTYHHLFDIPVVGLRFFTVYGPWGRPDMAYFSFTKAILENRPIEIFNHGHMRRDFTYIDDIIAGVLAAIDCGLNFGLFNLGHHHPEELGHMIAILEKELGVQAKKILLPMQPGDVLSTFADIRESTEQLGFSPKVSLEEGLSHFVRWYRKYFEIFR